jgi:outer membrane PBP1 activator LpoA protein
LNRNRQLPVPTLTLNYGEQDTLTERLFQFGLAPEQEAQQAAERAWLDGNNKAIMITPDSSWGKRVAQAFAEHWEKLGGTLMKQQTYPGDKNDFSVELQALLELDISKARLHKLKSLLRQDLRFEPRRRQDTDFIFLAAFPRQARLLRPQLKFHYASDLPIYATSHVFTGKRDRYKDRDMDDIQFCDTPWTLRRVDGPLKHEIGKLWPEQMHDYTRFFALGIDAYQVIPQLDYLRRFPHERFNGITGVLSLDEHQHILRTLPWAQFVKGLPNPL